MEWNEFARLGAERQQLATRLAEVERELTADMQAQRKAGRTIAEIMAATGGADSWVRKHAPGTKAAAEEAK